MKTTTKLLLAFCLSFSFHLSAQELVILGPGQICVEECANFILLDTTGQVAPPEGYFWDLGDGNTAFDQSMVTNCYSSPGTYLITISGPDGNYLAEHVLNVNEGSFLEEGIIATSGNFCPSDSLECDLVCENSTVTYTIPLNNPNVDVSWTVSGAENWTADDNEITVEWGEPGQGQIDALVGGSNSQDWYLSCGMFQNAVVGGDFTGGGFVYIDASPSSFFEISLSNGLTYTGQGGIAHQFYELSAGTYTAWVTDLATGITQECSFTIEEYDYLCHTFGVAFDITPATACNGVCNGGITPIIVGEAFPGFAYEWSTGETTQEINSACAGFEYFLNVYDSQSQCYATNYTIMPCSPTSCSSTASLCVEILPIPEASFETTPPANNGVVEICEGQTVNFNNQTEGDFTFTWDFGDGTSSSETDGTHTYLSSGTYEALLIARNECFCSDTSSITIIVEDAIAPVIDCAGTICPDEEVTYTTDADCGTFNWAVSNNGTIISGGGPSDNFITVEWGAGPEGEIELSVDNCTGDYCTEPLSEIIPIIDDNAEIEGPSRVCKSSEATYSMPAYAGTEFIWDVSSLGTIVDGQGTNEIIVQWAENVSPIEQTVSVQYESCYLGCGGSDELGVKILNEIFIEGPIEACPNTLGNYTALTPTGGSVQANWTIFNASGTAVANSSSATSNYGVNWSLPAGNYTVFAEVDNPDSYCVDNFSVQVSLAPPTPLPTSISGEMNICPGTTYAYTANSSGTNFDYIWYVSDGGNNYIVEGQTVNITWGATAPYTLALAQTNQEGFVCESETIEINPNVIATVSLSGPDTVCDDEFVVYSANNYQNQDFVWTVSPPGAGSVVSGEGSNEVEIQWHLPGTYDVNVSVCGAMDSYSVIVHPRPDPIPVYNSVCPNETDIASVMGTYQAYDWRDEDGITIANTATADLGPGYYEVIVTDDNGCTGNETFYVSTFGQPDVTISTPDFGNFCAIGGSMVLYALESSSGPLDYQWYLNGTAFGTNASDQTVTDEGTYWVVITDINGCTASSNLLTLNCGSLPGPPSTCTPEGYPTFEITPGAFCQDSDFTNTSTNEIPDTWLWTFDDVVGNTTTSSTLENPSHTWSNAGFNMVFFRAGFNSIPPGDTCIATSFSFDTIPVAADFVHVGICQGEVVSFEDVSVYIPQTSITGFEWDFGDPASGAANTSTIQNPTHVYNTGGIYTVTLNAYDQSGCVSRKEMLVEILNPPLTGFNIPQLSCQGAGMFFDASGSFTDVNWDFGDPASGAANTSALSESYHVYENPGTYTVTLSVENIYGCTETITEEVVIEPNNLSGFIDVSPASEVCDGDVVTLTAPMADSYSWSTGEDSQIITTILAGIYEVTIYDDMGCGYSPPSVVIDVIPLPQGQITAEEYDEFGQPINVFYETHETCFGEDVFLLVTETIDYTYVWSNGETTVDNSFTEDKENLLEVGTHEFTVTITDSNTGCSNVVGPFVVIVHPVPEDIMITSNPATPVCENTPTVISVSNPDPSYTYVWNTGEVGTSINTSFAGEYFVRAINEFGCEGLSNTLEIVAGPNIDLIPSGCHTRCNPDTICLPPVPGVNSFQWYLNGSPIPGPAGNVSDYIAMESGDYFVEMTNFNGCVASSGVLTLDLYDGFGTVQGNVYFDVNENGVIDAGDTLMNNIPIILQQNGSEVDNTTSNQTGSYAFSNILSTDYNVLVDELNLPEGFTVFANNIPATLEGCEDEEVVDFLIQFICPDINETVNLTACPGEMANYNGTDLSIGQTEIFTFTTSIGCDSMVTVTVTENQISTNAITLQTCTGTTIDYNGTMLSGGTVMDFTFTNSVGCDSVVTVTVTESAQPTSALSLEACTGTTVDYNGTDLSPGDQMDFTFTASGGCDSIVTVTVNELLTYSEILNFEACSDQSIPFNGENLMAGTTTDFNLMTVDGCDSIITVVVAELLPTTSQVSLSACENGSILFNGIELFPSTTTDITITNTVGCDSVITVTVAALPVYNETLSFDVCEGETIDYNGTTLMPGTVTGFDFTTVDGCDSTVTVTVNEIELSFNQIDVTVCEGETYDYNGEMLAAGTVNTYIFTNVGGCDSTVTVIVTEIETSESNLQLMVCIDETISYAGFDLAEGFNEPVTFTGVNDCDSIVNVSVIAFEEIDFDVLTEKSCSNTANGRIELQNMGLGSGPFEYSLDGINWQTNPIFEDMDAGLISVSVQDNNGCIEVFDAEIEAIAPISIVANIAEIPCDFSPVPLELTMESPETNPVSYFWEDGSTSPLLMVDTPGIYTVVIENECESIERQFEVELSEDARANFFYAPNLFTPNNDMVNDVWKVSAPQDMEIVSFEGGIFDRWGNTVKILESVDDVWDGRKKNRILDSGVFAYWFKATVVSCGRELEIMDYGDVTLVR